MSKLVLKPGVGIRGIQPETAVAISIVHNILAAHGIDCVITSIADGKHGHGSLHYVGKAFDVRHGGDGTPQTYGGAFIAPILRPKLQNEFQNALGDEFDVILEKTHFHIEHQPKTPVNS
jgi:hypothetical protein